MDQPFSEVCVWIMFLNPVLHTHSEVMREIREEKQHLHKVMTAASSRQVEVAGELRNKKPSYWERAIT